MSAKSNAPDISMMITLPATPQGVWRIENFDRSQPMGRFALALDGYSGEALFSTGWRDMPMLARATAVGIPFHRGEFGVWNQVLLVLAALTAIFSVVSGFAMWWLRRPRGRIAAPVVGSVELRSMARVQVLALVSIGVVLSFAMPVFGASLLLFLLMEALRLALDLKFRTRAV